MLPQQLLPKINQETFFKPIPIAKHLEGNKGSWEYFKKEFPHNT